ncbi:unnamed protein product [Arctia plantaginis]|uniref:PiggyBac transposable element-derived protein domain-containing protein n=1 Tax=Arctia plantaginis TaxID=874455 RepID=A0A8S1BBG5_ARCPL|nr:unnamed protein product [Arctia plantaginis]
MEIESGVKILSNVKVCPPIALPVLENEAKDDSNDSDYEIFPNPKRKRIQRELRICVSPITNKKFALLENAHAINILSPSHSLHKKDNNIEERVQYSAHNDFVPLKDLSVTVPSPAILLTPTQKRNINVSSQISTPDSISRFCTSNSRCPSLDNISLMPLTDETEIVNTNNLQCTNLIETKDVKRTFTYKFEEENEDTDIIAIQKNISQKRTNNDVTLNTNNNNMITIENGIKNTTTEEMLALPLNNKTPEKSFEIQLMIEERGYISESVSEVSFSTTDEENLSFGKSSLSSSEDSDELEDDDESRIESDWLHSQEQGFEEEPWVDITDEIPDFAENTLNCKILLPTDNKTPIEIYDLFVTEEIINKMVKETNDYAEKYLVDNAHTIKQKSRVKAWKPTNFEEMRQFFGRERVDAELDAMLRDGIIESMEHFD